jgi:hypothetical protein
VFLPDAFVAKVEATPKHLLPGLLPKQPPPTPPPEEYGHKHDKKLFPPYPPPTTRRPDDELYQGLPYQGMHLHEHEVTTEKRKPSGVQLTALWNLILKRLR